MEDNFLQCCNHIPMINQNKKTKYHIFLLILSFFRWKSIHYIYSSKKRYFHGKIKSSEKYCDFYDKKFYNYFFISMLIDFLVLEYFFSHSLPSQALSIHNSYQRNFPFCVTNCNWIYKSRSMQIKLELFTLA